MTWNPPDPSDRVPDEDSTNTPPQWPAEQPDATQPDATQPDAHLEAEYENRFVFDADELPY